MPPGRTGGWWAPGSARLEPRSFAVHKRHRALLDAGRSPSKRHAFVFLRDRLLALAERLSERSRPPPIWSRTSSDTPARRRLYAACRQPGEQKRGGEPRWALNAIPSTSVAMKRPQGGQMYPTRRTDLLLATTALPGASLDVFVLAVRSAVVVAAAEGLAPPRPSRRDALEASRDPCGVLTISLAAFVTLVDFTGLLTSLTAWGHDGVDHRLGQPLYDLASALFPEGRPHLGYLGSARQSQPKLHAPLPHGRLPHHRVTRHAIGGPSRQLQPAGAGGRLASPAPRAQEPACHLPPSPSRTPGPANESHRGGPRSSPNGHAGASSRTLQATGQETGEAYGLSLFLAGGPRGG